MSIDIEDLPVGLRGWIDGLSAGSVPSDVEARRQSDPSGSFGPGSAVAALEDRRQASAADCRRWARNRRAPGSAGMQACRLWDAHPECGQIAAAALTRVASGTFGDAVMILEAMGDLALPDLDGGTELALFGLDSAEDGLGFALPTVGAAIGTSLTGGGALAAARSVVGRAEGKLQARLGIAARARATVQQAAAQAKQLSGRSTDPATFRRVVSLQAKAVRAAKLAVLAEQSVANGRAQVLIGKAFVAASAAGKHADARTLAKAFAQVGAQQKRIKTLRVAQKASFAASVHGEKAAGFRALAQKVRLAADRARRTGCSEVAERLEHRAKAYVVAASQAGASAAREHCAAAAVQAQLSLPEKADALGDFGFAFQIPNLNAAIQKVESAGRKLAAPVLKAIALPVLKKAVARAVVQSGEPSAALVRKAADKLAAAATPPVARPGAGSWLPYAAAAGVAAKLLFF